MKKLILSGAATAALVLTASSASASDSFAILSATSDVSLSGDVANGIKMPRHMPRPTMGGHMPRPTMGGHMPRPHNVGGHMPRPHNVGGHIPRGPRFMGGHNAPGGIKAYRRPFRGYVLPSYWINPGFSVSNYSVYGLSRPANGYYWSRYYDDAVLMNNRGYVYDSVPNVRWDNYQSGYAPQGAYQTGGYQPTYAPAIRPDQQAYNWGDDGYAPKSVPAQGSRREAGTYEGEWNGRYVDPQGQTYQGEWEGAYTGQDGRRYEGTYSGTATGAPVSGGGRTAGAPYETGAYQNSGQNSGDRYQYESDYQAPRGYEGYEKCLRSNGVAGGAIGGVIGAIAGNRIAGRGNRTAGTLIGGGLGALAGLGVEKATKKCDRYLPREEYQAPVANNYPRPYPQAQPYPQPYPQPSYPVQSGGYGWQGGYYYPQQAAAPVTTITVTPGTQTTTTTTTEEVVYENVYTSAPRKRVVRKHAPRPKPRCGC
jgi:Ni/Co efflux regulator RcnB